MRQALKWLTAWSGVVSLMLIAALLFVPPAPMEAQTGVTAFGTLRVGRFYRAFPRTAIEITNNGYLTATGTFQRVTAAGTVGTSGANIAVLPAGTYLHIVNTGANSITFTETGTLRSAGNIVLGQYDAATLISDGANWTQLSGSNN